MFSVQVTPPTALLEEMNANMAASPALMATAFKRNQTRLAQRTMTKLRVEPGPPPAGITRLMTPRQRRAFFATNGFGGGIPHERTHAVSQGWQYKVEALGSGGMVTVFNDVPATYWVEWYGQQLFLAAMGWLYAPPVVDTFETESAAITESTWLVVSDPFANIPQGTT